VNSSGWLSLCEDFHHFCANAGSLRWWRADRAERLTRVNSFAVSMTRAPTSRVLVNPLVLSLKNEVKATGQLRDTKCSPFSGLSC
jgi:hypothetical protein